MSAFESVLESIKRWEPKMLPNELEYRDSLVSHLRGQLRDAKVEPEYRHLGTTTDIYVKQSGFFGASEVFLELKRNLTSKAQLDRLVGQIESLEPKKNFVILVLCGKTNPTLLARLRERYRVPKEKGLLVIREEKLEIVTKEHSVSPT